MKEIKWNKKKLKKHLEPLNRREFREFISENKIKTKVIGRRRINTMTEEEIVDRIIEALK